MQVYSTLATGNTWEQVGQTIFGEAAQDLFGRSVAISQDWQTIAAGAPFNDESLDVVDSGSVRVYRLDGNQWSQVGQEINGLESVNRFGFSLDMNADGTVIVAGAPNANANADTPRAGQVRVFRNDGDVWMEVGNAPTVGQAINENFGESVSISSDGASYLAGAPNASPNSMNAAGEARVYELEIA
jgi:hypothetical protein